jgi:hypothetical protein
MNCSISWISEAGIFVSKSLTYFKPMISFSFSLGGGSQTTHSPYARVVDASKQQVSTSRAKQGGGGTGRAGIEVVMAVVRTGLGGPAAPEGS